MRAWADLCGCVYMTVFLFLCIRVNLLSERFRLSNKITRKQIGALSTFHYSRDEHDKKTDYWQELGGSRQEGIGAGMGGGGGIACYLGYDTRCNPWRQRPVAWRGRKRRGNDSPCLASWPGVVPPDPIYQASTADRLNTAYTRN